MKEPSEGYRVGRGKPPLESRWKKGQSGNSRLRRPPPAESTLGIIDRLLAQPISVTLNGEPQKIPALKAILLQLMQKAKSGSDRAHRALLKYQEFATLNLKKEFKLTFIENAYTRAFAKKNKRSGND